MTSSELRQLFDGYMECFGRLDGSAAAAYYAAPAFVVKNGDVIRFGSEEKVEYFSSLMEANASAGPHRWEFADFTVATPSINGAIVTVHWVARRSNDSVLWDFEDTYVLGNEGEGWFILGDIVHDNP